MKKKHEFSAYARFRGADEEMLRLEYIYNLNLDETGKKTYNLEGKTVDLQLEKDLTLKLFENGKEIKSIPKTGSDPKKYEEAKTDYSDKKSVLKRTVKSSCNHLLELFLSGKKQTKDLWKKQYLKNPILRFVACLLIWQQNDKTFIVTDSGLSDVTGAPYSLTEDDILLAHPMKMKPEETRQWQDYLLGNALKQPFAQMWEPVVDFTSIRADRYSDCLIPLYRFNGQEKHGINLETRSEYDHHSGRNTYQDLNIYLQDCNLEWEAVDGMISAMNMQSMIRAKSFSVKRKTRAANHIVAYLDKCTVYGRIIKDDVSVMDLMDHFTAAQITDFLSAAVESGSTNVTAALLEYKNRKYADLDPLAEFTLDL